MKKNLFLIAAFTLTILSCKKSADSPTAGITMTFSQADLAYVQVQPTRYFIYKDSVTGDTDSVLVTKSEVTNLFMPEKKSTQFFAPNEPAYHYQTFTLLLTKKNDSSSADWFYGIADISYYYHSYAANTDSAVLTLLEKDRLPNADKGSAFTRPTASTTSYCTNIPNINIEGTDYSNVVKIAVTNGIPPTSTLYSQYYHASTHYWAKGVGIIKRTVQTASSIYTWTLVRKG